MNWYGTPLLTAIFLVVTQVGRVEAAQKPPGRLRVAACQLLNGPELSHNVKKILQMASSW